MFYTEMGRIVSAISFVLGIILLWAGFEMDGAETLIEYGFTCVLFSIGLGVLTDISRSLSKGGGS